MNSGRLSVSVQNILGGGGSILDTDTQMFQKINLYLPGQQSTDGAGGVIAADQGLCSG